MIISSFQLPAQPDYIHDVFISYRRNNLIEPWVSNFFLKLFEQWLTEKLLELGESAPRIFFDQIDNEPGNPWPEKLQMAVKHSKVLLSICSPSYFHSPWCKSEWEAFGERQKRLGVYGLRIPVRHNDCEEHLQGLQWSDFYGYTFLAKGFYASAQATVFETKVEQLAKQVADAIKSAPAFDSNWPSLVIPTQSSPKIPMQRL
jgi:hypothetical protein